MPEGWKFRPATPDDSIYNSVVMFNEYHLPSLFDIGDIVVDVGAHIGSFAYAVLSRGCQNVYSFEPDGENCDIATQNLGKFMEQDLIHLVRGAVWRSDPNDDELYFDGYSPFPESYLGMEGIINTGRGSVLWGGRERVPKLAFDDIVDSITESGKKRIRLLKLDCEGAEWPILFTSRRLHLIDEICGEFHEIGGGFLEISEGRQSTEPIFKPDGVTELRIDRLINLLEHAGFEVTYTRHIRPTGAVEGLGLFFATRTRSLSTPSFSERTSR